MPSDTPAPDSGTSDGTTTPSRTLTAELLQGPTIPAATAGTVSTSPKLPPFRGD